jgi:streptogramin lyase
LVAHQPQSGGRLPTSARDVIEPSARAAAWVIDDRARLWFATIRDTAHRWELPYDTPAIEISASADGAVWILAGELTASRRVLRLAPASREFRALRCPREFKRIAGGPDGLLWGISLLGEVWSTAPDGHAELHSPAPEDFAEDISAGPDGTIWIVSTERRFAGRAVKRLDPGRRSWFSLPAPASAVKIAGAPDGMAWTVNSRGHVWRLHPNGGGNLAECQVDTACVECRFSPRAAGASEVSVDRDGTVWLIGSAASNTPARLLWLADPRRKEYRPGPDIFTPVRVAAGHSLDDA